MAAALREDVSGSQCEGVLRHDVSLRVELAARLDERFHGALCDATAPQLLDVFAEVLRLRVASLPRSAPGGLQARHVPLRELVSGTPGPVDGPGARPGMELPMADALRRDWVLWHALASRGSCAALPEAVLQERVAIALSGANGACTAEVAIGAHTLEHLAQYIAWEASMADEASRSGSLRHGPSRPFTAEERSEVAARRVLAGVVPEVVAALAARRICAGEEPQAVLADMASAARRDAKIPSYTPARKAERPQPKQKRRKTADA